MQHKGLFAAETMQHMLRSMTVFLTYVSVEVAQTSLSLPNQQYIILANFRVRVALLSWLRSLLVAMRTVCPGDYNCVTTEEPADPNAILSPFTELTMTSGDWYAVLCFTLLIFKTEIMIPAFHSSGLFFQWVKSVIKNEEKITYSLILHLGMLLSLAII